MNTGFRELPIDEGFTRRAALYLAALGSRPDQIRSVLVEELDAAGSFADEIISMIAA